MGYFPQPSAQTRWSHLRHRCICYQNPLMILSNSRLSFTKSTVSDGKPYASLLKTLLQDKELIQLDSGCASSKYTIKICRYFHAERSCSFVSANVQCFTVCAIKIIPIELQSHGIFTSSSCPSPAFSNLSFIVNVLSLLGIDGTARHTAQVRIYKLF